MKRKSNLLAAVVFECLLTVTIAAAGGPSAEYKKTFGGSYIDWSSSVHQTSDGGYIIAGRIWSYGAGACDVWLIKTYAAYTTCGGDLDANSIVNLDDLNILIGDLTLAEMDTGRTGLWTILPSETITGGYWRSCSDMDSDGDIDLADLNRLIGNLTW